MPDLARNPSPPSPPVPVRLLAPLKVRPSINRVPVDWAFRAPGSIGANTAAARRSRRDTDSTIGRIPGSILFMGHVGIDEMMSSNVTHGDAWENNHQSGMSVIMGQCTEAPICKIKMVVFVLRSHLVGSQKTEACRFFVMVVGRK